MVLVIHVPVYLVAFFFSEPAESENLKDKQSVLTSPPSDSDDLSSLGSPCLETTASQTWRHIETIWGTLKN